MNADELFIEETHNHNYEVVAFKKYKPKINLADVNLRPWKHNNRTTLEQHLC